MHARLVRSVPLPGSRRALTGAAAALLTLTACGSTGSSSGDFNPNGAPSGARPATDSTPQAAPPPTMSRQQIDKLVLDRYREYQRVYKQVYETNDPAQLATVAMDPLLTTVTEDVERTRAKGVIWRFTNISNPRVYARSKDGLNVYVVDCMRTLAGYRFSTKTGKRTGGGTGSAYRYRTAVSFDAGVWKVSNTKRDSRC
ncbi:hypothetical protein [Actinomadura rudentiformis]|uniref:Nuclear transport factor 2 family protein n=1 Tax=Actinomadura rudentiformis TaxID=359158 RepID=A0A6H9Y9V1_9ACTN|nr:hypothetical protein [Actinomadura rudentiformis]KAB2341290.1 hypothetical protein F8566_41965 [Actinomadura rudentiformis]